MVAADDSCVFCKIVRKQLPASIIYEDQDVMVFLDIRPLNMGHTLVIPKAHFVDIFDIPDKLLTQIQIVAKKISLPIKQATEADGISVIQQNGRAAGQEIFHFHTHVVPRFKGQKLPRYGELKEVERHKLDKMADKIKEKL
ncbi:MAG: HIT family protein [Candidatus Bathyarchaeia archaeon]